MNALLLTGATGYIGGALLERLVKDELHVPVVAVRTVNLELPFEVSRVTVGEISPATDW